MPTRQTENRTETFAKILYLERNPTMQKFLCPLLIHAYVAEMLHCVATCLIPALRFESIKTLVSMLV